MALPDPGTAPPRRDLPYLRHRGRPRAAGRSPALADFMHGNAPHPARHHPAPASAGSPPEVATPAPAARPPSPAPPSLDLSAPAPPARPPSPAPPSLDLTPAQPPTPVTPPSRAASPALPTRRTTRPGRTLLAPDDPVVVLNRLESAVGTLQIEAVVGPEAGDLRIGAAFALADGRSSTVDLAAGRRTGPLADRRPVIVARHEQFEQIAVDLRQTPTLARLLVYAFSPGRAVLSWSGTLVLQTYGGRRIEAPIGGAPAAGVLALLSVYNVGGELVVRAEMDPAGPTVRETALAFGYDQISWLDDRTPLA